MAGSIYRTSEYNKKLQEEKKAVAPKTTNEREENKQATS